MKILYIGLVFVVVVFILYGKVHFFEEEEVHDNKYIFIEVTVTQISEPLEGPEPHWKVAEFDPEYSLYNGFLEGEIDFSINKNLRCIIGYNKIEEGISGCKTKSFLEGVYTLPFFIEEFQLIEMDEKGTIKVDFREKTIEIEIGKKWNARYIKIIKEKKIREIIELKIENKGFFEKDKIIKKENL